MLPQALACLFEQGQEHAHRSINRARYLNFGRGEYIAEKLDIMESCRHDMALGFTLKI